MLARTPLRDLGGLVPGASAGTILPAPEPGLDVAELGVTLIQLARGTVLIVVAGMHCAAVAIVYVLRFASRAAGRPAAVVTLGGCPHAYGVTVNGRQQPSSWDNGKLRTAAGTLLGIRYPLGA